MENLYRYKKFLALFFLFNLFLLSSTYTVPDQYFINCGSSNNVRVNFRMFIGDENSDSFTLTARGSTLGAEDNPPADLAGIYQTARIFDKASSYELDIALNGTYVVRLHFYPLTSQVNTAQFNVLASEVPLLSNFSIRNSSKLRNIQEFLLPVTPGKLIIRFTPSTESSFAFVSAIEAFLAPESLIPDSVRHVTPAGSQNNYNGLLSRVLHVSYRINVGGPTLTADNDTLLRNWEPDDGYLLNRLAARPVIKDGLTPKYQDQGATKYDAPDQVYNSAKELNYSSNMTWLFNASRNAPHRARFHFCNIISETVNENPMFNLYIYSNFVRTIKPSDMVSQPEAPFYYDFVVDSDDSGVLSITIGLQDNLDNSTTRTAFLNGLEIMEITSDSGPVNSAQDGKKIDLVVIIAPVAGGVVFILILVVVLTFIGRRRKQMPVETSDWPLAPVYVGTSYGGSTERTGKSSLVPNLNLGLKLPLADILFATKNFDKNLMIGEGGFGKVYRGTLHNGVKVAVKRSEPGLDQGLPEFHTEINILSRIRHGNLVSLIGYCDERSEMILVYEFMEKGTLRDHLYKFHQESKNLVAQSELSWQQRLEICIGAAKGLHYLHAGLDRPIIHRDVKSTNILLDEKYVAKVSDFGLSRSSSHDQTHVSTLVKGSFGYLDPEYFRFNQLTQKSDVYSFGVVLLEVLCARPAINQFLRREEVNLADWGLSWQKKGRLEKIIDPFLAGQINPNSLRKFGEIVEKCLEEYGADRPSMVDVLWSLEYALRLQLHTIPRQPHEDSTTDVSVQLPLPVINRLPSHSFPISENEMSSSTDMLDSGSTDASQVFSQLKMDEAR